MVYRKNKKLYFKSYKNNIKKTGEKKDFVSIPYRKFSEKN